MSKLRIQRLEGEITRALCQIITEVHDPKLSAFATVMSVKLTADLSHATVFVSVMEDEPAKSDSLSALSRAQGFMRTKLGMAVQIRRLPELHFKLDTSMEYGKKIDDLLKKIALDDEKRPKSE